MLDSLSLIVPSMISKLCKRVKVEILLGDTCMEPKNMIFPRKMCGEGSVVKRKMRKMDYGKFVHVEDDSPIPSIMGPFTSLASELRIVKDIIRSYVTQREFDASLSSQRKKKPQLVNLEKAYACLAKSHGELSISHGKMKKQEKSRDKFFTRMWNGVKCLWKLLKVNEPLPTSRSNVDRDEL
ncbi:hypothetical protein H5410_046339, partial [Solanum commersonii]